MRRLRALGAFALSVLAVAHQLAAGDGDPGKWWSLQPLRLAPEPGVQFEGWSPRNPIDHFIGAKLKEKGLTPAPEADRRTLIRRLFFDLTGLPPAPDEVERFVADPSPGAYEKLVDRLLASPRYGERWARRWMDLAHFAETHGHDQDRIRENAWPYRDYLIAAFNSDKPYNHFVEEQVAGDVIYPDDPQATVALGFLVAGPWDESSLRDIREDSSDRQIARYIDRDDVVSTVMQTFVSTTVQCARCHNHKFDPISQRDYYALQAVFSGVDRANRRYDPDPVVHRKRRELGTRLAKVEQGDKAFLLSAAVQDEVALWEKSIAGESIWKCADVETFGASSGAPLTRQDDGSLLAGGTRPERDTFTVTVAPAQPAVTAVRLEILPDKSLPKLGPGRADNGNLHLSEFQLLVLTPGAATVQEIPLATPTADFNQDGWTIAHALDRNEKTAWGIFPKVSEAHVAVFPLKQKLTVSDGTKLIFVLKQLHGGGHVIGRFRVSLTDIDPTRALALPQEVRQVLDIRPESRTEAQRLLLTQFQQREKVRGELTALPPPQFVYAAASDFEPDGGHKPSSSPRPVQVLKRGDITKPIEEAVPGALSCVRALPARFTLAKPADEGSRRAALAHWLTDPENPLTWRTIVNRAWQDHFGRGLVDTPNDFGQMGGVPSHPELLDWLAIWFRDHGESLKQLHKLIVTSATYRQRADVANENGSHIDGNNRLLRRMNRARLDAESIRDAALAISGQLDLRMGGPSDRQFDLKPGLHVTPNINYKKFDIDTAAGRRRSVYRFLFRTLPDPLMDALDCPAGDQLTPVRNAGVTVQQALVLWNSPFMARQCEHLATRLEHEAQGIDEQLSRAFVLTLCRPPTDEELSEFTAYARQHGLANACRVLLNSNEFLFVN
ncbi:DUF1549 and DUF1553 domain-containing protein [Verrucomicrobiota bacterium sgz303538]